VFLLPICVKTLCQERFMTTELAKLQARIEKLERDARHQRRWSATWLGTFLATVLCGGVYLQAAPKTASSRRATR
jgi:hypothetical protein